MKSENLVLKSLMSYLQEKGFSSHSSYSLSKLASQFFTKDLSERVKSRGLTANCLDPGTVNTKMLFAGWGPCGINIKVHKVCMRLRQFSPPQMMLLQSRIL